VTSEPDSERTPVRIVFFGTPEFVVPVLDVLHAGRVRGWHTVGVLTQPDRPAGRGGKLQRP